MTWNTCYYHPYIAPESYIKPVQWVYRRHSQNPHKALHHSQIFNPQQPLYHPNLSTHHCHQVKPPLNRWSLPLNNHLRTYSVAKVVDHLQKTHLIIEHQKLKDAFEKHLIDSPNTKDIESITKLIIREIHSHPTGIMGRRTIRYEAKENAPLHHLIFHKDGEREHIELLITPNLPELSRGSVLVAFEAQHFLIPLDGGQIKQTSKVFKTINPQVFGNNQWRIRSWEETLAAEEQVMEGLEHHSKLSSITATSDKVHLAAIPVILSQPRHDPGYGKRHSLEIMQDAYKRDLTFSLYSKNLNETTLSDILTMMEGVGVTLDEIHSLGHVHRDVKPANLLEDFPEDFNTRKARLSDFDSLRKIGPVLDNWKGQGKNYPFHDKCSKEDFLTPLADTYGTIVSLLCIVAPNLNLTCVDNPGAYFNDQALKKEERENSIKYYIQKVLVVTSKNQSDEFSHELNDLLGKISDKDLKNNVKLIQDFVRKHEKTLTKEAKDALLDLPDHIEVILSIFDTYVLAYQRSEETWKFLQANPHIQQDLSIDVDKTPPQFKQIAQTRKNRAIKLLEKKFFSMKSIIEWIKSLFNTLKNRKALRQNQVN